MNGILPLWKPKGLTSHDCVVKIRKRYQTKKVGHTGTLDPEVEGVLPICIGQATKVVPFLTDTKKTYIAELKLGIATETEDSHGEVIETSDVNNFPTLEAINETFRSFTGEITQIPPMYSAVKVNGKKLYEYARANETVERPLRQVHIYELKLLAYNPEAQTISFKVICSKGTYIRTLCVDLGRAFGYPAHMSELTRTATGEFTERAAVTFDMLDEVEELEELKKFLKPLQTGLTHLPALQVDLETKKRIQFGQKLPRPAQITRRAPFVIKYEEEVLAVYQIHEKNPEEIKAVRVFQTASE